ncbi:MAG TPA: serine/threonine-protein kinase [Devosia sp.]|jgi:serine/threonine protein kinase
MIDLTVLPHNIAVAAAELAKKIDFESISYKGGNGYLLIGRNRQLQRKVVVKFYYWGDGAHAEPKLLSDLASPNVLEVHDAAAIDEVDAYFITPFCEHGDLDDVMAAGGIGVRAAVDILLDVASGISFIHSKGYLHRDLKPSNVFRRANGSFVIGDFGSVVKKGDNGYAETASRHALLYRTPEEVQTNRAYEQSDIYQLGIILYQLMGGRLPYDLMEWLDAREKDAYAKLTSPDNEIYANSAFERRIIVRGKVLDLDSLPAWCPAEVRKVIHRCARVNHEKRFESASALLAKLNNIRAALPDWRCEPEPVLYRRKAKFRVVSAPGGYAVEKMVATGTIWRKVHAAKRSSLKEAFQAAESL